MSRIIFSYARMNPPTKGHQVLVDRVDQLAKNYGCTSIIIVSHVHDRSRNPLIQDRKMTYILRSFPSARFLPATSEHPSMVHHLAGLSGHVDDVTIVAGPDRMTEYSRVVQRCSGRDFSFRSIDIVQAGDDVGRAEYSATAMRLAAIEGRLEDFIDGTVLDRAWSTMMYNDIRLSLGLINIAGTEQGTATDEEENSTDSGEVPGGGEPSVPDAAHPGEHGL